MIPPKPFKERWRRAFRPFDDHTEGGLCFFLGPVGLVIVLGARVAEIFDNRSYPDPPPPPPHECGPFEVLGVGMLQCARCGKKITSRELAQKLGIDSDTDPV